MIALVFALAGIMAGDTTRAHGAPRRPLPALPNVAQAAPDQWLGEDKFQHFSMSFAITAFGYAGARTVFDRDPSIALAVASGAAAGVLKEIRDRSVGQPFSVRDLVWDAAGVVVGYLVIRQTSRE